MRNRKAAGRCVGGQAGQQQHVKKGQPEEAVQMVDRHVDLSGACTARYTARALTAQRGPRTMPSSGTGPLPMLIIQNTPLLFCVCKLRSAFHPLYPKAPCVSAPFFPLRTTTTAPSPPPPRWPPPTCCGWTG